MACNIGVVDNALKDSKSVYFFSKVGCTYCIKLEESLDSLNIPYTKYVLDPADSNYGCVAGHLKDKTAMTTFPMLYIGLELVGGYSDFKTLEITNGLEPKLKAIGLKIDLDF